MLRVEVESVRSLRFDDGTPVRAASGIAPFGGGWLVAQDDAAHAAWLRGSAVERLRVVPAVEGHDVFSGASGTKHLKPDLEAACPVEHEGAEGVLLLGSGSTPARMRAALVTLHGGEQQVRLADLSPLYAQVAEVLALAAQDLNLEGACRTGGVLRWFARGNLAAGVPSASVDVDLASLLAAVQSDGASGVRARHPRTYELGSAAGVGLTVTDAVALPGGQILVSAAAEDTPNAVDDGPVVASALALLLRDHEVRATVPLPDLDGRVAKVEGLALVDADPHGARLLAVVDDDDPERPSTALLLRVSWS